MCREEGVARVGGGVDGETRNACDVSGEAVVSPRAGVISLVQSRHENSLKIVKCENL